MFIAGLVLGFLSGAFAGFFLCADMVTSHSPDDFTAHWRLKRTQQ